MNDITVILSALLRHVPCILLIFFPFRRYFRYSSKISCFFIFLFIMLSTITSWFSFQYKIYALSSFFYIVIMLLYFICFFRLSFFQILFLLFFTKNYTDVIMLISRIILVNDPSLNIKFYYKAHIIAQFMLTGFTFYPMYLFFKKWLEPLIETSFSYSFWKYLWMIPFSNYFIYRLDFYPIFLQNSSEYSKGFFLMSIVWIGSTILTCFLTLQMLWETMKNGQLQKKLDISQLQIQSQREQYALLQKNIDQVRRMRHDIRHHFLMIREMIKTHPPQEATEYLNQYIQSMDRDEKKPICENYAVDAIVSYYISLAEKEQIHITSSVDIPLKTAVAESDLCILFGNLLENALEACLFQKSEPRFIQLKAQMNGENMITILVKNSYENQINCINHVFFSSKRMGTGIGIESVRTVAHSYHGLSKFTYQDGIFTAYVFLNPK